MNNLKFRNPCILGKKGQEFQNSVVEFAYFEIDSNNTGEKRKL